MDNEEFMDQYNDLLKKMKNMDELESKMTEDGAFEKVFEIIGINPDGTEKKEPEKKKSEAEKAPKDNNSASDSEYTILVDYDFVHAAKLKNCVGVCFYIERIEPLALFEKIQEINEEAYMNGYNWEAFFNYYLEIYEPDLLIGLDSDSEAGLYSAYYYEVTSENGIRAEKFAGIIKHLIENEDELYRIIREEGHDIAWD